MVRKPNFDLLKFIQTDNYLRVVTFYYWQPNNDEPNE